MEIEFDSQDEERLQGLADRRGLTVQELIRCLAVDLLERESCVQRGWRLGRALAKLRRRAHTQEILEPPERVAALLAAHRERAVLATTAANMGRLTIEKQEREAAEAQLSALRLLAEGNETDALTAFQRYTVMTEHVEAMRPRLAELTEWAGKQMQIYRQEEERVRRNDRPGEDTVSKLHAAFRLDDKSIRQAVIRGGSEAEWLERLHAWAANRGTLPAQLPPDLETKHL